MSISGMIAGVRNGIRNKRLALRHAAATARASAQGPHYRAAFGKIPVGTPDWIKFPFEWGTPEAAELQNTIWKIESRVWKTFIETLKRENIVGSLTEFGVSVGNSLEQLIDYCAAADYRCKIFGFDSFQGLPKPVEQFDMDFWHEGEFAADYETVGRRLRVNERPYLKLYKGWFAESFRRDDVQQEVGEIAFARIDCDLYEPAVECLDFIVDRLVDGAYLCFDDWTDDPEKGETKAFFDFAARNKHRFRFEPACRISLGGMHMRVFHK